MILPSYIGVNNAFVFPTGGLPPVNITPASISGVGYNGQTLTAIPGSWDSGTVTGQWFSNGSPISGETGLTYDVNSNTEGTNLLYRETADNGNGITNQDSNTIHNWIPTDSVASNISWWDFSDSNQVSLSGSAITQIDDKGGLSEALTQGTNGNRPSLQTGVQNGLDVARFNRTSPSDYLQGSSLSKYNFVHNGGDATVAVVMDATEGLGTGPNRQVYAGTSISSGVRGFGFRAADTDTVNAAVSNGSGFPATIDATDYTGLGSWSIVTGLVDANDGTASNRIVMRFDGSASSSSSSGSGSTAGGNAGAGMTIGSNPTAPGGINNNFNGDIGELVILNNQGDEEELEGYFAWKWDLVGSLPIGHPYKNSPPTP